MEEITINFGLVASEKFPDVARARVLTRGTGNVHLGMELQVVAGAVLGELYLQVDILQINLNGNTIY